MLDQALALPAKLSHREAIVRYSAVIVRRFPLAAWVGLLPHPVREPIATRLMKTRRSMPVMAFLKSHQAKLRSQDLFHVTVAAPAEVKAPLLPSIVPVSFLVWPPRFFLMARAQRIHRGVMLVALRQILSSFTTSCLEMAHAMETTMPMIISPVPQAATVITIKINNRFCGLKLREVLRTLHAAYRLWQMQKANIICI